MAFDHNVLPLPKEDSPQLTPTNDPALSLIRNKVSALYVDEPSAAAEATEATAAGPHSKHQQFMKSLLDSGKDMADVQTEWHAYYQSLDDTEKQEVWQEFYANHARTSKFAAAQSTHKQAATEPAHMQPKSLAKDASVIGSVDQKLQKPAGTPQQTVAQLKNHLLKSVQSGGKLERKHHVQSLLFGLGMGCAVMAIFMFSFFNERVVAPFITPSRSVSNTPIIVDPSQSSNVGPESKVLIPKINVEVPVVYDISSIEEKQIQSGLERGVVHYPTSAVPGQNGNVAIVGHSSNNIFNKGKYKFAFVSLSKVEIGDTFMLHYGGTRYVYKVYDKRVVKPTDVSVLERQAKQATATLITCDPPGTALNRLIVVGEQISPALGGNIAATTPEPTTSAQPAIVPGNAESLFQRLFGWIL